MHETFQRGINQWRQLLEALPALQEQTARVGAAMLTCWDAGGKLLLAGNGGSAADAIHLAEELVVRYNRNRRALAAIALTDPATLTCAGNDLGFDTIFARQIEALGRPGDLFIAFTTSGNSPNILRALETARARGLQTVGFLGRDGGQARPLCDLDLTINSPSTARIQEAHQLLYHILCEWIDEQVE